ncbi:MAG: efflux RND transporter periplasmic adaptor subunit [Bryobacteraceae bacterium]
MKGRWMALAAAAALITGTGCPKQETAQPVPSESAEEHNPMEITVNEELFGKIKIGKVGYSQVADSLRVAARVEADERHKAVIGAPVTGRITELSIQEGQMVRSGQVMATLYSTELTTVQSSLIKANTQRQLAQRASERAQLLLRADVIGAAELQRREAELQESQAEVAAARDHLKVLGMTPAAIAEMEKTRTLSSVTQIRATIEGTVLERKVTIGQVVQATEPAFVVADLSRVWLVADIPEQIATNVRVGKFVEAEVPALPGHLVRGKISFVSSIVNPDTRTVMVRMDVPNPKGMYKPSMLATMSISEAAESVRVVPVTAVVREENRDFVLVREKGRTFAMRPVNLGAEHDDVRVLVSGVERNEEIVLDGAFHVNNERRRLAIGSSE